MRKKTSVLISQVVNNFSPHNTVAPHINSLVLIFKVWLMFCILWGGYIYLFGDIRFMSVFPRDHWINNLVKPFAFVGIRFVGNLLAGLIIWGVLIPFILANYVTKKLYKTHSWIVLLIYVFLLQAILYITSIAIDYLLLVVYESKIFFDVFKGWEKPRFLKFLIRFDRLYIYVFTFSFFITIVEIQIRIWRNKNGTT
jgi:hypothetical protein